MIIGCLLYSGLNMAVNIHGNLNTANSWYTVYLFLIQWDTRPILR
jgi:hypothetical protein